MSFDSNLTSVEQAIEAHPYAALSIAATFKVFARRGNAPFCDKVIGRVFSKTPLFEMTMPELKAWPENFRIAKAVPVAREMFVSASASARGADQGAMLRLWILTG